MRQRPFPVWILFFLTTSGVVGFCPSLTGASRPGDATSVSFSVEFPLAHGDMDEHGANSPQSGGRHFISWIGHFHPPMTVFPIAMLLSAALAELLRISTKAPWLDGASRWCVIIGGIGGAITAPLGWAFATGHGESRLLEIHRWLGTAAGAGAVVLLVLSEVAHHRGGGALIAFRTLLFLAVPLVGATGFFGGAMVYGIHEYDWNRPHSEPSGEEIAEEGRTTPTTNPSSGGSVTQIIMTEDDTFKPDQITIPTGTTVRWKNASKGTHTVTDDPKIADNPKDVASPPGAKSFNSGRIRPGQVFEHKFTIPGTYRYICEPHEDMDMKGQVVVTQAGASPDTPTRPTNQ